MKKQDLKSKKESQKKPSQLEVLVAETVARETYATTALLRQQHARIVNLEKLLIQATEITKEDLEQTLVNTQDQADGLRVSTNTKDVVEKGDRVYVTITDEKQGEGRFCLDNVGDFGFNKDLEEVILGSELNSTNKFNYDGNEGTIRINGISRPQEKQGASE